MARNQFGGPCYRCGLWVEPGTGYFERHKGGWRVQHAYRGNHGGVTCSDALGEARKLARDADDHKEVHHAVSG